MFRVLFDWRARERKGPNFHYLVRIIIIKNKKKKKDYFEFSAINNTIIIIKYKTEERRP